MISVPPAPWLDSTDATVGVAEIVRARLTVCVRAGLLESATLQSERSAGDRSRGRGNRAGRSIQDQASRRRAPGQRPGVGRDAAGRCEASAIGSTELTGGQRRGGDLDLR